MLHWARASFVTPVGCDRWLVRGPKRRNDRRPCASWAETGIGPAGAWRSAAAWPRRPSARPSSDPQSRRARTLQASVPLNSGVRHLRGGRRDIGLEESPLLHRPVTGRSGANINEHGSLFVHISISHNIVGRKPCNAAKPEHAEIRTFGATILFKDLMARRTRARHAREINSDPTRRMSWLPLGKDCKRLQSFEVEFRVSASLTNKRPSELFHALVILKTSPMSLS